MNRADKEYYCWSDFVEYCREHGISTDNEEDWKEWWEMWCEGFDHGVKET